MEHKCEQYSEEWTRLRLGKPTASGFHHIITPTGVPTKKGPTRNKYKYRLVAERLLGQAMDDSYESKWMARGAALENDALDAFIAYPKKSMAIWSVNKCGYFTALDERVGASPDGVIVGSSHKGRHLLEIKCAAPYTHVGYLIDGPGTDYKAQCQGQMWVTGAHYVHFWAYHPSMPPYYEVKKRDDEYIGMLAAAVSVFCAELDEAEAHCRGLGSYRLAEKLRLSDEMSVDEILTNLQE